MNQELERFEPSELKGRIAYEHLHRYAICRDRVAGQRVLDVACGAGYGSSLLAQSAANVTGLDIDARAINRAKKKYRSDNLSFVTADCYDMPFSAGSFDVVVANEMIEHIDEQDAFIEEVKRVLAPGGMFLVSTPNKPVYNRYKTPNPYHVSELDIEEFRELLKGHFKHVHLAGMRMALVSAGFDLNSSDHSSNLAAAKTYSGRFAKRGRPDVTNDELHLADPEFLLATCSDEVVEDAPSASTIFFSNDDDLWLEHEKIMAWASQLHEEDEVLRADLRRIRAELDETRTSLDKEQRSELQKAENFVGESRQYLATSSRLLSRLTGTPVEAEPVSMIEAMFSLNEKLVEQRFQCDRLAETSRRASDLEQELQASRVERERIAAERDQLARDVLSLRGERDELAERLRETEQRAADSRKEQEAARAQSDRLAGELDESRSKAEQIDSELRSLFEQFEAYRTQSEQQLAKSRDDLEDARNSISQLQREAERADRALQELVRKQAAERPQQRKVDSPRAEESNRVDGFPASAQQRKRTRMFASHREVQDRLSHSHAAMRGKVSPAVPDERTFFSRLRKLPPAVPAVLFDRSWIASQIGEQTKVRMDSFVKDPRFFRVEPHPLMAAGGYLDRYPDVGAAGISPVVHYLEHGWREGRDPHPFFITDWYLEQNPDVLNAGTNPLVHYLEHGWKEGRWPNPIFDPKAYLKKYPDVAAAGIEPLTHFAMYGMEEDREVPFRALEGDWRLLVGDTQADSLMGYLLSDRPDTSRFSVESREIEGGSWPPPALNEFWIPQALRDFMIERGLERLIPLYTYFYSVMDAYADEPAEFEDSPSCRRIVEQARRLSLKRKEEAPEQPTASVIIPVYNNILDTLLCILSLLETNPCTPFEVIVADDQSSDATPNLIPELGGIVRYVRQPENVGFISNCNAAAEHALGKVLVFLNNDTLALPGWLDELIVPFDQLEGVGLTGSKLLNWDGRLQEAGGIFWKDASAWNFGRGQNPLDPEFNYLKEVDYCSGASIAVASDLWRELGGFDPIYRPAYCEDADLAFRIREAGFRTIYSPRSELIHHEGRSHGRDTGTGIKAYQVANQQRFLERWRGVLKSDHFANGEKVLRARDRSGGKPHILVIDHYVPQADKDAGSRTMFEFLHLLIEQGWAVTFWPENLYRDPEYTHKVQDLGVEVIYGMRFVDRFSEFLRSRAGLYDAVLLSRPHVAAHFIDDVRTLTQARIVYYGHDVHFERMKAQSEIAESVDADAVEAMKTLEVGLCNRCDVILYPSADESRLMSKLVSKKVQSVTIPAYRFQDRQLAEADERISRISPLAGKTAKLLFVGGFSHGPNGDGIAWFCREVAPILRTQGFRFDVTIVGSNPTAEVWDLEEDDTHVLGHVSDDKLSECYLEASIVIAPLRFGAGVKGKVVEAMARGVPVVTTTVGTQGLSNASDYLFLGDTAEEFAAAVQAAADAEIARSKARSALEYVRNHFSTASMMEVFRRVLPSTSSILEVA